MRDRFGIDWTGKKGTPHWRRPVIGRRMFFRHAAGAVGGWFLLPQRPIEVVARASVSPAGSARNCVFVLMSGGPSHTDTFDLKPGPWMPASFQPTRYGDILFPRGLFPKLAGQIDSLAFLRSVRAWNTVHELSRNWVQIARDPCSSGASVAPHIGSVVAMELAAPAGSCALPPFLSLDADGAAVRDFAPRMPVDNLAAATALTSDADARRRYGNSGLGNACLTARNLLRSNLGTRFVQITAGGWDNHASIYSTLDPANPSSPARRFDTALGALIADLKTERLLDQTLVVAMGEFGRTAGPLNAEGGRDHSMQQAVLVAGAGIRGGRAIGSTNPAGNATGEPGWSRERDIRPEDIDATIYSALGINWTTTRKDDRLDHGFEYIPRCSVEDAFGPVRELW